MRATGFLGSASRRNMGTGTRDIPENQIPLLRGALAGLQLANDTDTEHDISIAVGAARDSTNVVTMNTASAIVKRIDANWVEGTTNGGFPSGLSIAVDTWYHVFGISTLDGTTTAGSDPSSRMPPATFSSSSSTETSSSGQIRT